MKNLRVYIVFLIIFCSAFSSGNSIVLRMFQDKTVDIIKNRAKGKYGEAFKDKISFKKIFCLGVKEGPDYLMFGRYIIMDTDTQENIFIFDRQKSVLYKFDKAGKFVWKTGRSGQGPGEFKSPHEVKATNDGGVIIVDQAGKLKFFNDSGEYIKTIHLEKSIKSIINTESDRIFANIVVRGQPGISAAYFNKKGELIEYFPFEYHFGPKIPPTRYFNLGGEFRQFDDLIFLSIPDKYEILIFSADGKIIEKILVNRKLQKSYLEDGYNFIVGDRSGPCYVSTDEFIVNRLSIKEDEVRRDYLDFFDSEYHLLGTIPLAEHEYLKKVDSYGHIYILQTDPFLKLDKYEIDIEDDW